jgi:hypothetical protein
MAVMVMMSREPGLLQCRRGGDFAGLRGILKNGGQLGECFGQGVAVALYGGCVICQLRGDAGGYGRVSNRVFLLSLLQLAQDSSRRRDVRRACRRRIIDNRHERFLGRGRRRIIENRRKRLR